jgi:hypothetical protein
MSVELLSPTVNPSKRIPVYPIVSSDCNNLYASVIAKSLQDGLAILPRQPKRSHIGKAKTSHCVAYGIVMRVFELPLHHGQLCPVNQIA